MTPDSGARARTPVRPRTHDGAPVRFFDSGYAVPTYRGQERGDRRPVDVYVTFGRPSECLLIVVPLTGDRQATEWTVEQDVDAVALVVDGYAALDVPLGTVARRGETARVTWDAIVRMA